jgi:hypothetical protein
MKIIKAFKLVTGEEVVGELKSTALTDSKSKEDYLVGRPNVLRFQQVGPNQLGLTFVPWILSNPDIEEVTLSHTSVIAITDLSEQVERNYLEQTSGIDLASGFKL